MIPANGGRSRLIVANTGGCNQAAWSPDGSTIAYAAPNGVVLVDVRTGAVRGLPKSLGETFYPAWAPNGTLYVSSRPHRDDGSDCLNVATPKAVVVRGCP